MMMTTDDGQVLLPVSHRFLWGSVILALLLEAGLLQFSGPAGLMLPDVLLLVLLFWALYQPYRVGVMWAFVLGLCVDVLHYGLLGQHALTYVTMVALIQAAHRRLVQFPALEQAPQLLPIFVLGQFLLVAVGLISSWTWPGWWVLGKPVLEALLWPVVVWVLQAPQRRPPDDDAHRPL